MAAGERLHCLGVLRLVIGEVFGRQAVLEMHKGIEDAHGEIFYAQIEEVGVSWESLKEAIGAADYKTLCRIVEKLGAFASTNAPALKKSKRVPFDGEGLGRKVALPNLL